MEPVKYLLPPQFKIDEPQFEELRELYSLYRDYMKHEDDLINQRSTWHLLIQGFLFGTLGVVGEWPVVTGPDRLYLERWFLVYVLAVAGALIAIFAFVSVKAANDAISSLCSKWSAILNSYERSTKEYFPAIAGGGDPDAMTRGKRPAMWIPLIVAAAWILIIIISAIDRVYPHPADMQKPNQNNAAQTGTSPTAKPLPILHAPSSSH